MEGNTWLITGGAGYIGSHVVRDLQSRGVPVVVLDDLSTGDAARIDAPLEVGSMSDEKFVVAVLQKYSIVGVIHLAAKKQVAESVARPLYYYGENVGGLTRLLSAMQATDVNRLVFSSSAAVYGMPDEPLVTERSPTCPANPYGESKLIGEWLVRAQARATGLRHVILRYFNVAGAGSPDLMDKGATNLVPLVFQAVLAGKAPAIFGADYPTPDGTCIRDFVHVSDLASAHTAALALLDEPGAGYTFNVGTGTGYSVRQVIDRVAKTTGIALEPAVDERRAGDPARVVGDVSAINTTLGWRASLGLGDMISSVWAGIQDQSSTIG